MIEESIKESTKESKEDAEKKESGESKGLVGGAETKVQTEGKSYGQRTQGRVESSGYRPRFSGGRRGFYSRKRFCLLCKKDLYEELDYKNEVLLRRFITEKGKILPRRISGLCARAQRLVKREIKRARMVALLPFTQK